MCEATSFSPLKQRCRCFRILRMRTPVSLSGRPLAVEAGVGVQARLAQPVRPVQRARKVRQEIRVQLVRPPRALGLVVRLVRMAALVLSVALVRMEALVRLVRRARSVQLVRRVRLEREQPCRSSP
jgi:hypothetical protein